MPIQCCAWCHMNGKSCLDEWVCGWGDVKLSRLLKWLFAGQFLRMDLFTRCPDFPCSLSNTGWDLRCLTTEAVGRWSILLAPGMTGCRDDRCGLGWWPPYSGDIHISMSRVVYISRRVDWPVDSAWLWLTRQAGCWLMPGMGRSAVNVGRRSQDTCIYFLAPISRGAYPEALHDRTWRPCEPHVQNAVCPLPTQVPDEKSPLLLGFHCCPWMFVGWSSSILISPIDPQDATWCDEGVVAHVSLFQGLAGQVCEPVTGLIMSICDISALLAV